MFRIPSRQVFKALRYPLGYPVSSPLCFPQKRNLHDVPEPYSGPPSYTTIARRFSSLYPSPISYFAQKKVNEDIQRGEFVDIHDVRGIRPKDFDVLITDLNHEKLKTDISELVGIPFLKEARKEEADIIAEKIHGFIYGDGLHLILPCVLTIENISRWVFFIVDTGAPFTFISTQVAEAFGLKRDTDPWLSHIAGYEQLVRLSPEQSHFSSVSLLGCDFCNIRKLRSWFKGDRSVTYYIGDGWRVVRSSTMDYNGTAKGDEGRDGMNGNQK